MSPESILAWNLASVSIQGFLYGLFFILFCGSTYLLAYKPESGSTIANSIDILRSPMFIAGMGFFLTVTGHWIMVVFRSFQAFVHFQSGQAPELFYEELAQGSNIAKTTIMLCALLIADAVLVYRVFIIWSRARWVTIIPFVSFLGNVACSIGTLTVLPKYEPGVGLQQSDPWILANVVITVVTNFSSAFLIGYKMWLLRNPKHSERAGQDTIWWVLAMFIENAFLYVAITLAYFIAYQVSSASQFLIEETLAPLVGITFMLINVRVGMGYKLASDNSDRPFRPQHSLALRPLAVTITQVIDREVESEPSPPMDKMHVVDRRKKRVDILELTMKGEDERV